MSEIRTTYYCQGEGRKDYDRYSTEPAGNSIKLVGWGHYGRGSVLAGQTMKSAIAFFDSFDRLHAALVDAGIDPEKVEHFGWKQLACNSVSHLPDSSDLY